MLILDKIPGVSNGLIIESSWGKLLSKMSPNKGNTLKELQFLH